MIFRVSRLGTVEGPVPPPPPARIKKHTSMWQVAEVAEQYKWGSTLEGAAERLWRAHTSSVFTPLEQHVTPAQLASLETTYKSDVANLLREFLGQDGVVEPYTLLLVKASV
jgi:hypothetical protein